MSQKQKTEKTYLGVLQIEAKAEVDEGTDGCDVVQVPEQLLSIDPNLKHKRTPEIKIQLNFYFSGCRQF